MVLLRSRELVKSKATLWVALFLLLVRLGFFFFFDSPSVKMEILVTIRTKVSLFRIFYDYRVVATELLLAIVADHSNLRLVVVQFPMYDFTTS